MRKQLDQLVERLRNAFGNRLVSVILYGSGASADHDGVFSDLNVLCVLDSVTSREIADGEHALRWWRDQGNPSPLLLSRDEVHAATDCFPIEFHDLQERRRVLYGEDVCTGLVIDDVFYRAEVEHELRAKLLRLRQKAALVASDREMLLRLMADSVSTFCVLGRHALRLAGRDAPAERRLVPPALAGAFGIPGEAFYTLLDLREGKVKPRGIDPVPLLDNYLKEIAALIAAVDRLER